MKKRALFILLIIGINSVAYASDPDNVNGWYMSKSSSDLNPIENGVRWSPIRKPTTIHRYFNKTDFRVGEKIEIALQWRSDGYSDSDKDFDCSRSDPTGQGRGISDRFLRCIAGTGDFRIGLFQSAAKVYNGSCEGNRKKTNCPSGQSPTKEFNDYQGFQFRIHPHLSRGFNSTQGRYIEYKSDGREESHINISLWTRKEKGENGLMSDECQAIDHCGFSKSDYWGTQPQMWGPEMPFGDFRELRFEVLRIDNVNYQVTVEMNGQRAPLLTGRFPANFSPSFFDTIAITYTNSSRKYDYVEIKDLTVNGEDADSGTSLPPQSIVSHLEVDSGKNYRVGTNLQVNDKAYIDRDYVYTYVWPLEGKTYIQTANDDDNRNDESFLSFKLSRAAHVYVLIDQRKSNIPSWLNDWELTGYQLATNDTTFNLYKRTFNPGKVNLGGNGKDRGDSMYTVIIEPTKETGHDEIISSLRADSGKSYRLMNSLKQGELVYIDRNYRYTDVSDLEGLPFILWVLNATATLWQKPGGPAALS